MLSAIVNICGGKLQSLTWSTETAFNMVKLKMYFEVGFNKNRQIGAGLL